MPPLPKRPPLLCPGCPHTGVFFVLNAIGQRSRRRDSADKSDASSKLVITGDIGCYTLAAYPPLNAIDTCACMGAGIGQAQGIEHAGADTRVVAVIGDSTFLHSGITSLINAVYNGSHIIVLILDNSTTAMTGHQEHPGTGRTAQGVNCVAVDIEAVVRGIGVKNLRVVDAFDLKALRVGVRAALDVRDLSVIIVRGACAVKVPQRANPRTIAADQCDSCQVCLRLGCPAIGSEGGRINIDSTLCMGDSCTICEQLCPHRAIGAVQK